MDDFIEITKDWLVKKYLPLLGRRFWSFKIALSLFLQLDRSRIVETGCIRKIDDWDAGYSTLVFAEFASKYGVSFDSIDISEKNIEISKKVTEPYKKFVKYHCGDSLKILREWNNPIDLLYLDSVDCDPSKEEETLKAQRHQFQEFRFAEENLTKNAIVLLDDNYFDNGGKTRLTKEYLKLKKWINIMDYEQSLWVRGG